jgi:alpha-L-fucosidase 2
MLYKLLRESTAPNLMDTHPRDGGAVFQIDGNFGACAAITLMLIQEDEEQVILLPACPADWQEGSLKGVRLKGNAKLSFDWQGGRVKSIRIAADGHYRRTLLVNETAVRVELNGGEKIIDL